MSVLQLADQLRTEADAYHYLEQLRWGDRPVCPHCGSVRQPYFLTPENGHSRKTRTGASSQRRVWKCAEPGCRKQFSVLTGTVLHGTKIPVRTWMFVIFEMASSKNGVSAREIERKYGLTPRTAWFMLHRVREAMKREPSVEPFFGRVVADETWYGGRHKNRHASDKRLRGKGIVDKTPIMSLVSRETGEVRSRVVPDVKVDNLRAVLIENVDPKRTHLHTDTSGPYRGIGEFASHTMVNHRIGEYVRGDVSTNQAESYFAQLKRSLDGTHHHVSREHLHRYVAEFDFRFSTRDLSDTERTVRVVAQAGGKRLTYSQAG
ncbi:MAG: IS1595 family transposase [Solirubrobacteraceae bacterium]